MLVRVYLTGLPIQLNFTSIPERICCTTLQVGPALGPKLPDPYNSIAGKPVKDTTVNG